MRDILVLTDDCQNWKSSVGYAAGLAAALDGSLTGAFVTPNIVPIGSLLPSPWMAEVVEMNREATEKATHAAQPFRKWAADRGIARSAWRVTDGPAALALDSIANWYDALVIGRSADTSREYVGEIGPLLLHVDLPCFVVPDKVDAVHLDTIAVAWNGSPESVRSLRAAMPLLRRASRIILIRGKRRAPGAAFHWQPELDVEAFLDWYGLKPERVNIDEEDDSNAGAAILAQAKDRSADLLVLGAYGRTRFSEWFFGGVTRHVLEHATLPLFMRH